MSGDWLTRFHQGERAVLEECYRDHFATVDRAVARVLAGADRETVVHEVFYRLLTCVDMRAGFGGGAFPAWLTTVARHAALDHLRAHADERLVAPDEAARLAEGAGEDVLAAAEARDLVASFLTVLPAAHHRLFQLRFVERMTQREAARALGVGRTTLAYRELIVRRLLRRFLLRSEVRP